MTSEELLRLAIFLAILMMLAGMESLAPRREHIISRNKRWVENLGLSVLNQLLLRLCFPVLAVGLAVEVQQRGWGLFNMLPLTSAIAGVAGFLLLDLAIYLQHRVFHRIDWLWRLHRVHHSDLEFDVTTAVRFHPLEMILSMAIKLIIVIALGVSPLTILVFEIALNLTAMFNHSNLFLPTKIERGLRFAVVTPDMHRIHHSVLPEETNSNFGFNLPWWDHLFSTYRAQPREGHANMTIGLNEFRAPEQLGIFSLLRQPFDQP